MTESPNISKWNLHKRIYNPVLTRNAIFNEDPWNPNTGSINLGNFNPADNIKRYRLDIDEKESFQEEEIEYRNLLFGIIDTEITPDQLVKWVTGEVTRPDVVPSALRQFVSRVINDYLIGQQNYTVAKLVQFRVPLVNAIKDLLNENYEKAVQKGFQKVLDLACETPSSPNFYSLFEPGKYTPSNIYERKSGSRIFTKHFYPQIHDLKYKTEKGEVTEEYLCAEAIDTSKYVKRWIRIIEKKDYSFYLPVPTGRFFPDFVAELTDGRILVVEYKGENLYTNADSQMKRLSGKIWEENNKGKVLFLMATKNQNGMNVRQQIENKIVNG